MYNSQNFGSWLLDDMQQLDYHVRLFGDMLRNIDDLSNLLDFYQDKISGPSAEMLAKGSLLSQ